MINKSDYTIQALKELLRINNKALSETDFEELYSAAQGNIIDENPKELANRIITTLFPNGSIPWEFFKTPVGEILGQVHFKNDNLLLPEISEYLGCSLQFVHKIKEDLKATQIFKTWTVKESNFEKWLQDNKKPSLWELKKQRHSSAVKYETSEETIINPGFESEVEYK